MQGTSIKKGEDTVRVVAMHALGMRCGRAESASEKIFKELFGKRSSLRISVYTIYTLLAVHSILLRLIHPQSPYSKHLEL